jgi:hypothetical protein
MTDYRYQLSEFLRYMEACYNVFRMHEFDDAAPFAECDFVITWRGESVTLANEDHVFDAVRSIVATELASLDANEV